MYVFLTKSETKLAGNKWNSATTKKIKGQLHSLINVSSDKLKKIKEKSGRRKGVKVIHKGKTYRAFPKVKMDTSLNESTIPKLINEFNHLKKQINEDRKSPGYIDLGSSDELEKIKKQLNFYLNNTPEGEIHETHKENIKKALKRK